MSRRLEWSARALRDVERITDYYAETATPRVASMARDFIAAAAVRIAARPLLHRSGKCGTRECVLRRFPYTIVYRASGNSIRIVRVMHQARSYFM